MLGSTRLITNTAGNATGTYRYSAYGTVADHDGATSAIGYTGNWTDPDSTLVYLRARDYNPTTGQFLQVDPAVESTRQPYAYVGNDPLASTDPSGLCGDIPTPQIQCIEPPLWAQVFDSAPANWFGDVLTAGPTGEVSNFVQGIGNGATLGLTGMLRQALTPQYACTADQFAFYGAGTVTGTVAMALVPFGAATAGPRGVTKVGAGVSARAALTDVRLSPELGAVRIGRADSADRVALTELAKDAKRPGVTDDEAKALTGWADELGLNYHEPMVHAPRSGVVPRGYDETVQHITVDRVRHIPVRP